MHKIITKTHSIRWLFSYLIFFSIISCRQEEKVQVWQPTAIDSLTWRKEADIAYKRVIELSSQLKDADIITRTGNDFTSQSLRSLNQRDKTYSHVGIISRENDSLFVYHALGGEWNPDEKVKREPLLSFVDPYSNNGIGIFRFNMDEDSLGNIIEKAKELYEQGVQFDMQFDLASKDKMYCAEYIYNVLQDGSGGFIKIPTSHINNFKFVGVDDIFLHPYCNEVARISFRKTNEK